MTKTFRPVLCVLLGLLLWAMPALYARAPFAISVVQTVTAHDNDVAVTFGSNWTSGNHVFIVSVINATAQTLSITGVGGSPTVNEFHDESFASLRAYAFCFEATATADNSFTATTSGGASASVVAIELAGASCTEDGASDGEDNNDTIHAGSGVTTTVNGSFLLALVRSDSVSNFTALNGTPLPASSADFPGGDGVGVALASYQIVATAGATGSVFTSAATENAVFLQAAVQPGGGGGGAATPPKRSLLGLIGGQ